MSTLETLLDELESLMTLQLQGIEDFQETQNRVRDCLLEKNWPDLERGLHNLEFKTNGLDHVEVQRHNLWQKIRHMVYPEQHADFHQVAARLPAERRERLGDLHRRIKVAALRLKGTTAGIDSFVQATSAVLRAVITDLTPNLRGRIYGRQGQPLTGEPVSLVLNQSF